LRENWGQYRSGGLWGRGVAHGGQDGFDKEKLEHTGEENFGMKMNHNLPSGKKRKTFYSRGGTGDCGARKKYGGKKITHCKKKEKGRRNQATKRDIRKMNSRATFEFLLPKRKKKTRTGRNWRKVLGEGVEEDWDSGGGKMGFPGPRERKLGLNSLRVRM